MIYCRKTKLKADHKIKIIQAKNQEKRRHKYNQKLHKMFNGEQSNISIDKNTINTPLPNVIKEAPSELEESKQSFSQEISSLRNSELDLLDLSDMNPKNKHRQINQLDVIEHFKQEYENDLKSRYSQILTPDYVPKQNRQSILVQKQLSLVPNNSIESAKDLRISMKQMTVNNFDKDKRKNDLLQHRKKRQSTLKIEQQPYFDSLKQQKDMQLDMLDGQFRFSMQSFDYNSQNASHNEAVNPTSGQAFQQVEQKNLVPIVLKSKSKNPRSPQNATKLKHPKRKKKLKQVPSIQIVKLEQEPQDDNLSSNYVNHKEPKTAPPQLPEFQHFDINKRNLLKKRTSLLWLDEEQQNEKL